MIAINDLTFGYRKMEQPLFEGFSLTIPTGARRVLTGHSGRGKTTLLRLIMGLEKPRKGSILHDETGFAAAFQEDRLIPSATVLENVALFSDEAKAAEILAALGLSDVLRERPAALSGGMKRRAALARALAHPATALILDEPLTGLDADTAAQTLAVIDRYAAGRTLLMVSHDSLAAERLGAEEIALA